MKWGLGWDRYSGGQSLIPNSDSTGQGERSTCSHSDNGETKSTKRRSGESLERVSRKVYGFLFSRVLKWTEEKEERRRVLKWTK
jgi:hypothetical protein